MKENNKAGLLARYEKAIKEKTACYFDAEDFEEIAFQYETADNYAAALEAAENGLMLHPGYIGLNIKKVKYLLYLGRTEEAESRIGLLPADSEEVLLIVLEIHLIHHRLTEAVRTADKLLHSQELTTDICFEIVDLFTDYGYLGETVAFVDRAVRRLPDPREILRELALIYEEKEMTDEAIAVYNRLLDIDPYSYTDWFSLAKVHAQKKEYEKAIDACDFALTAKENDEGVLSFKGYCYYDMQQYQKAIETFKEFAARIEEKSIAYELIAECYLKLEQNETALKYLLRASELDPENSSVCYQIAASYYDMGNTPQSIAYLHKTLEIDPADADALSFLGEIKISENKLDEACEYLKRSLEISGDNIEALTLTGDIYIQKEEYLLAIGYYEKALQVEPFDVQLIFKLILAYYSGGFQEKGAYLTNHLEEMTRLADDINPSPATKKADIDEAKELLEKLKIILHNNLNENI